jgi:hypothetical protein
MGLFQKKNTQRPLIPPTNLGSLTASGSVYRVATYTDAGYLTLLRQEWQRRAYDVYDVEGHLYYATNYVGNALARCKLVAAKRPLADGNPSRPVEITEGPIYDAVRAIDSEKGGQSGILRNLGRNIFLAGEAWLIADEVEGEQSWEAVSVDELTVTPNGSKTQFMRRKLPGAQPIPLNPEALTIRVWKEHPRYSEWADAGTRSCMELLEKIITLNKAEKAIARSRMAGSGILALPQELVPPGWQNQMNTDDPTQANPLWSALAEAMIAPLKDEGHPSSVMPFLLVGPGEIIKNMKYEEMNRTFDTRAAQLSIQNAVEQIASTLELPKEILINTGEQTHFTAWAVREDVFRAHLQPLLELICEALTRTYLRKALDKLSPAQVDALGVDPEEIIIWYDASQLIIQPDRSDKVLGLHDRLIVSDAAVRRESGLGEEDAPSEEEYKKRVGVKVADPGMAVTGKPTPAPTPVGPGSGGSNAGKKKVGGGGPLP